MKTAPATRLLDAEPEALIKEARRHQRRRYLAAGSALAAALAGAASVLAGLHGSGSAHPAPTRPPRHASPPVSARRPHGPPPIPRSLGTTVLMWPVGYPGFSAAGGPAAYVDDLGTGRLTQSSAVGISAGDFQPLLAQTGRWLVYVGNGTTAIRDDLRGRPRDIGRTPFFAPAAVPGQVWLFRIRAGHSHRIQARLVPVAGGLPGPAVTLPARTTLPAIRGTDAGLLLQTGRRLNLALWSPGSRPRTLPYAPSLSDGFDATARLIAYGTSCTDQATAPHAAREPNAGYEACAMLRVLDVVTGRLTSYPAPPGTAGWVPNGFDLVSAISPGDRMIAAYAAVRPQGQGLVRLYLAPIARPSGQPAAVPSSGAYLFARTAWSVRGSWLFYQGPGGHLWAYQVTSGATRASSTPCCQYTVMTAAPSHSG